jgi:hypothetical protein
MEVERLLEASRWVRYFEKGPCLLIGIGFVWQKRACKANAQGPKPKHRRKITDFADGTDGEFSVSSVQFSGAANLGGLVLIGLERIGWGAGL